MNRKDATTDANGATQWLSVARAAQLEGVSVRAVQRRCQSGKYRARRTQTPQGERLEVDAATLTTQGRDAEPQRRRDDEPTQRRDASDAVAPQDTKGDQEAAPNFAARYVAQIEAENAFLRATVEQHQRSEAELRAALREALKAQPRQLESITTAPPIAQEVAPTTAPTDATRNAQTPVKSPPIAKGAAPVKEPRPLWKVILGLK